MIHTTTVHLAMIERVTWSRALLPVAYAPSSSGRGPVTPVNLFAGRSQRTVHHAAETAALRDQSFTFTDMIRGSGQLTRFLLERGRVDRLAPRSYPLTAGTGKGFVNEVLRKLTLNKVRTFSSGVVLTPAHPADR